MEDKHLKLKHRFAFGAMMAAFLSFSLLVFGPLSLYINGNDEMWFSFRSLLMPVAIVSLIGFAVVAAILSLPNKTVHKVLCCLAFGAAIALYIQCGFFNISYGSGALDGSQIAWKDYTTYGAIDSAMWAACLALPFALYMVFKRSWRHILMVAAAFIMVMQIGGLAINIYQNQGSLDKLSHEVTTEGIYELSDKENTLVFVVSSLDQRYYENYKKSHPEFTDELQGFTEYDNVLATGAGSIVSFPSMLTGDVYKKDIKYTDFIDDTWNSYNVFDLLTENGVDTRIFCDDVYFGNSAVRKVDNVVDRAQDRESYSIITNTMYRYTLYNSVPHYLKRFFWMSLDDYSSMKSNITYTPDNDDKFFADYSESGGFTYTDSYDSAVRIYMLKGAKSPYRLTSTGQKDKNGTSLEEQIEGEFYYLNLMIEDLKKSGRYDDARIIITADNGDTGLYQNAMLLYKDKSENEGYAVSNAPVTLFDLPATLASTVTDDYSSIATGTTFRDAEHKSWNRRRLFYKNAGSNADSRIEEYKCLSLASDTSNLSLVNDYYINGGVVEKYDLGTELTFTTDETAAIYCKAGFGHTNGWRTIMSGSTALMEIPLSNLPANLEDLHAYFNVLSVYEETQCIIRANGKRVYTGKLDSSVRQNGLNFLIPTSVIGSDRTITLEFSFPDIAAQEEQSGNENTNIMALTSFKIYYQ